VLARLLILAGGVAVSPACGGPESQNLVVATCWPRAECARLESEFRDWIIAGKAGATLGPVRVEWLLFEPGEDLVKVAERRDPADVILGGSSANYLRLANSRRLAPLEGAASSGWLIARRSQIGLVEGPAESDVGDRAGHVVPVARSSRDATGGSAASSVAFDDPRIDQMTLRWAESLLGARGFRDGYARLVQTAARATRIGRQAGSAGGAAARGEAELVPAALNPAERGAGGGPGARRAVVAPLQGETSLEPARTARWVEGAAIMRRAVHPEPARVFVRFLAEVRAMPPGALEPSADGEAGPEVLALLGDLLGGTLVDAQDELWEAWRALELAGFPPQPLEWMMEPPPWPPASITKLQRHGDASAIGLMEALAREIAPAPAIRADLMRSWLSPPRSIEMGSLFELAGLAQGRLYREPRFRSWLKAEWTAWARQRYRRVTRVAHDGKSKTSPQ
jgi:hypothetical protein